MGLMGVESWRNLTNFARVAHEMFYVMSRTKAAVFSGFARGFDDVKERAECGEVCGCRKDGFARSTLAGI